MRRLSRLQIQGNPVSQVLTKRLISNIYIKVHWHGTTESRKCAMARVYSSIRVRNSIHFISWLRWSLYWHSYISLPYRTARPVYCAHCRQTLWWHGHSAEKTIFSCLLDCSCKHENDYLLHITNVQRGHPCVKGSRKARMKDYGRCLHNCIV